MASVRAPEQLSTALEFGELRSELAQEMCALKLDIVKMKCDLLVAVWRGTAWMMSLLTALLVSVIGILTLLIVKL